MTDVPLIFDPMTPADVIDRSMDFKNYLARGETILAATVTSIPGGPDGLTLSAPVVNGSVVTTFASGGLPETSYYISFYITTSAGRLETRSAIQNVYSIVP